MRVELVVPPARTLTLLGLMLHVGQKRARQAGVRERVTFPLNPLTLVSVIVEDADVPATTD